MAIVGFVLLSILYYIYPHNWKIEWSMRCLLPVLFFIVIYKFKSILSQSIVLRKMGQLSFAIYILQTPICTISTYIFHRFGFANNILTVIISQIIVCVISYYIAYFTNKNNLISRYLYPRSINQLRGIS